ncbi:MAG: phosphotransferase family protein [Mycobacteriales bacterium]
MLRRPPLGHVLATAHDMGREYTVMAALAGTDVPVPQMVTLCTDTAVLGAPFYLMSFVDGTVYRRAEQLAALSVSAAEDLADQLVDVLARLHSVDPAAVGLSELGRPTGFLERQVRRWGTQLAASHSREVPGLLELGDRLAGALPRSGEARLVHGDYKLDNVVVAGQIVAVLDWEMATLGDRLTDLVNLVIWWEGVRDTDGHAIAVAPSDAAAFPPASRLIDRYRSLTGADLDDLPWYVGLASFKLAAIFEGMHYRQTQGLTVGEGFDRLAGLAPALAQRGHDALDGAVSDQ